MAALWYLFKNRVKFSITEKSFYVSWAKRILTILPVVKRNFTRSILVWKGAEIHPTAEVGKISAPGHKNKLKIGSNTFIGQVEFALHDTITIGNNVCINDGCLLLSGSHNINDPFWVHVKKPIIVEDFVWIATNVIILPGVRIGKGAVIGAGAVVSKDIPEYSIAVGNPSIILSKSRTTDLRYNPCEFIAGNMAWLKK